MPATSFLVAAADAGVTRRPQADGLLSRSSSGYDELSQRTPSFCNDMAPESMAWDRHYQLSSALASTECAPFCKGRGIPCMNDEDLSRRPLRFASPHTEHTSVTHFNAIFPL
jgi:hypothetical protein